MASIIYQLQSFSSLIKIEPQKKILIGNAYYQMNLKGTLPDMYIREGVWQQLLKASESLPAHMAFYLFDTYRSLETQKDLFLYMKNIIKNQSPHLDEETLLKSTRTFVADPFNLDIRHKLSHPTGGAVDLGLFDLKENQVIDMGTPFDDPTELSSTDYFANAQTSQEKNFHFHRTLLLKSMLDAGFTNYSKEWWHYDLGDYSWANKKNVSWHYDIIESI
jgi:D-alanyl-D-alanine dipeptidase